MRVIHTADWHLGQELRGFSRGAEQARFLDWMVVQCRSREADALVVAGDVFDQANPAAEALGLFFRFAERLRREAPGTTLVAVAGNHDGATRFDALAPALREGMRLVGAVPRDAGGAPGCSCPRATATCSPRPISASPTCRSAPASTRRARAPPRSTARSGRRCRAAAGPAC